MDVEARKDAAPPAPARGKAMHRLLVALNIGMLALGAVGGPLLSRLYFSKGGHRQWLSAWLQTGGWPLLLVPVAASYAARRARNRPHLPAPPPCLRIQAKPEAASRAAATSPRPSRRSPAKQHPEAARRHSNTDFYTDLARSSKAMRFA